ncbi:MAG: sensor histidine kinase [Actinomycetota bacterium]
MLRLPLAKLVPRRLFHLPSRTVRLRLTLLYSGLFLVSGVALRATMYLLFRNSTGVDLIVPNGHRATPAAVRQVQQMYAKAVALHTHGLHQGLIQSAIALAILTAVSIGLGWLVAGHVLRPLRVMTATTRQISERNLSERLALQGPRDELKVLADTVDGLLARLEAHVAEQQRFAANASHELRTPLAITQTLLDVARNDPSRASSELDERLRAVNARAIDLTEALLLLSRAGQKSFTPEHVDLSLIAEEATETLVPLAEEHGVTIETSGEMTPAIGSEALLIQLATNLVHNAIVHNLPEQGTVCVRTSVHPETVVLTVENTGEKLTATDRFDACRAVSARHRTHTYSPCRCRSRLGNREKHRVQAHDGTLTLTPRAAGGLTATVHLPAAPSHIRPAPIPDLTLTTMRSAHAPQQP